MTARGAAGRGKTGSRRAAVSLKGRGLALLAQRDHSRVELKRKLMPHARALMLAELTAQSQAQSESQQQTQTQTQTQTQSASSAIFSNAHADSGATPLSVADRVNEVLDWLEARDYLSDTRFAESRTHARSTKFGNLRIRHELSQHGVALTPESALRLQDSEFERARELQARKFGRSPSTSAEHAKQSRFLVGRGFSHDAIRQVMRLVGWAVADGESEGVGVDVGVGVGVGGESEED